jgi:hypothetical protein
MATRARHPLLAGLESPCAGGDVATSVQLADARAVLSHERPFTIRDGIVVRDEEYSDRNEALEAAGLQE